MPGAVTYEVYALINERWLLDTSFRGDQRQRAIDEAQQLAKRPDVGVSKVIRETYDASRQRMKETTVFRSDRADPSSTATISSAAAERHADQAQSIQRIQNNEMQPTAPVQDQHAVGTARARSTTYQHVGGGGTGSPFATLVLKVLLIGITSFAFATFTTWVMASA